MKPAWIRAVGLVLMLGACATADRQASTDRVLSEAAMAALIQAVPPPPAAGSERDRRDRERSRQLAALEGSDRWLLATTHAELRPTLAAGHFDCALGTRLGEAEMPALTALFQETYRATDEVSERIKARFPRLRPVGDDPDRVACQRLTSEQRRSSSYPSGSAAVGAAYADILADLVPDRSAEVRRIGHEIAVSRMVCAMHWPSDVEAGEALGQAVATQVRASPTYAGSADAARAEIAAARAAGLANPACAAERAALAQPLP